MKLINSFSKIEHLKSKKNIVRLFTNGLSLKAYPLILIYSKSTIALASPVQLAISVPKKSFKRAVDRNRIKRLIREAWRTNKHKLYEFVEQGKYQIAIMIIYKGDYMPDYEMIRQKIMSCIAKLMVDLSKEDRKN